MKTWFISCFAFLGVVSLGFAQDIITTKKGEDIESKVLEVTETEVTYKKFDNQEGPSYTLRKSMIVMIRYENGTKDVFGTESDNSVAFYSDSQNQDLYVQGQMDAGKYYKGYKGAGTGTLIASLVSPIVGLVPAIATSSTQPKDENLDYPNSELMKKADYYNGYSKKAKKVKQGKVWTNWAIGFGVNLVAILILTSGD